MTRDKLLHCLDAPVQRIFAHARKDKHHAQVNFLKDWFLLGPLTIDQTDTMVEYIKKFFLFPMSAKRGRS